MQNITRREFVKSTAAVTAGMLAAPLVHGAGGDTIKVGLVGCGGRGTGAAAQALDADPGVVIWAMGDVFDDKLTASLDQLRAHAPAPGRVDVPAERQYRGFDAYQRVIDSGADVIILATPPHFRPAHLDAAVSAGRHVFCEKPMAVDATGVRRVMEVAERARQRRLSLVAGFCWRYSLPERETYRRVCDGQIGEVVSVHTTYHGSPLGTYGRLPEWSDMEWQLRNWWHFRWLSGDHIVEQACHSIDKINWAMNGRTPLRANALGGRFMREGAESGNVYDHFTVIYEYEGGQRCFHTCRQMPACALDNSELITGTEGRCFVNGWGPTQVIEGKRPWRYAGPTPNMYQVEHDELFKSIRTGEPINDGVWMAQSTLMSILGRMAAYSGQTVTWEQAMQSAEDWTPPAYEFGDLPVEPVAKPGMYRA